MAVRIILLLLVSALACNNENEDACETDPDCPHLNMCISGCCVHKDLMPLAAPEAGGTILVFVIAGMANAGGIGGGSIMTAFELILFAFPTKLAIPISQCIITSGALISLGIRMFMRHPTKNRPLLEYHVSMLIIPPVLLGSTFGVMANKVLPTWAILAMLTIVLVILTYVTLNNGVKMYKSESKQRRNQKAKVETERRETESHLPGKNLELVEGVLLINDEHEVKGISRNQEPTTPTKAGEDEKKPIQDQKKEAGSEDRVVPLSTAHTDNHEDDHGLTTEISRELRQIYARESKQFPLIPIVWIIFIVTYVALGLSIRGGGGTSFAGIAFCGEAFKTFFGLWSAGFLILCFLPCWYLLRLKRTYDRLGYEYDQFDIKWTKMKCFNVWISGLAGGVGGSLLGFGASLIVAPILIQWKLRSSVIGPTASLMSLIGSAISVMQYAEQDSLNYAYGGWLAAVGFIGSMLGVISITALMKKLGRPSLLVLVLGTVIGIAMIIVPVYSLLLIIQQNQQGKLVVGFTPYC